MVQVMLDNEAALNGESGLPRMSRSRVAAQSRVDEPGQRRRRRRPGALILSAVVLLIAGGVFVGRVGGAGRPTATSRPDSPVGAAFGSVSGTLRFQGITAHSVAGTVVFVDAHGQRTAVRVPSDGRFSIRIPAGIYAVTGHSPQVLSNGAETICTTAQQTPVIVHRGATTPVALGCEGF